jgi:hypothetical protein
VKQEETRKTFDPIPIQPITILPHGSRRVKTPILEDTMKPMNPIIKHDTDLGWEIFIPQHLLPIELRTISISPAGLYLETIEGGWDLIPFQDLADLMDTGSRSLDECIDIDIPTRNRSIIAKLTCPVNIAAGQPEPILTGQERAYRRWDAAQQYAELFPGAA